MPQARVVACPICKQPMSVEARAEIEIDVCEAHGIWLDQPELLKITEFERKNLTWSWKDLFRKRVLPPVDRTRQLNCPVSGEPMRIEQYKGVHMDWSPAHGLWLDNGELEAILSNLRLEPMYMRSVALRLSTGKY